MLDVEKYKKELSEKTYRDIQTDTSWAWAGRACAAYERVLESSKDDVLVFWTIAEEFTHESLEHSSLVEDGTGKLVKSIQDAVTPYQERAVEHIKQLLGVKEVHEYEETSTSKDLDII